MTYQVPRITDLHGRPLRDGESIGFDMMLMDGAPRHSAPRNSAPTAPLSPYAKNAVIEKVGREALTWSDEQFHGAAIAMDAQGHDLRARSIRDAAYANRFTR